jgi:hypothetical protein
MDPQPSPHTAASLSADLRALGVGAGDVVLLHASRRNVGFVAGGTQAIVHALLDVLASTGTLVVPTHTPENTDPAMWRKPPVPESWWRVIREQSPGFDPRLTPASRWMGVLAETVRTWPGAVRSDHPQVSFAAIGGHADDVTADHRLDDALGENSPLGVHTPTHIGRLREPLDGQQPQARSRVQRAAMTSTAFQSDPHRQKCRQLARLLILGTQHRSQGPDRLDSFSLWALIWPPMSAEPDPRVHPHDGSVPAGDDPHS